MFSYWNSFALPTTQTFSANPQDWLEQATKTLPGFQYVSLDKVTEQWMRAGINMYLASKDPAFKDKKDAYILVINPS